MKFDFFSSSRKQHFENYMDERLQCFLIIMYPRMPVLALTNFPFRVNSPAAFGLAPTCIMLNLTKLTPNFKEEHLWVKVER